MKVLLFYNANMGIGSSGSGIRARLIAEGLQADFLITEENPLGKITRGKEAIQSVYSRGFCVFEKSDV